MLQANCWWANGTSRASLSSSHIFLFAILACRDKKVRCQHVRQAAEWKAFLAWIKRRALHELTCYSWHQMCRSSIARVSFQKTNEPWWRLLLSSRWLRVRLSLGDMPAFHFECSVQGRTGRLARCATRTGKEPIFWIAGLGFDWMDCSFRIFRRPESSCSWT